MSVAIQHKQSRRFCQSVAGLDEEQHSTPLSQVLAYHQRSKHSVEGYAAGPASLDWEAQPSPYRRYINSEEISLPFSKPQLPYSVLFNNSTPAEESSICPDRGVVLPSTHEPRKPTQTRTNR